MIGLILIFNFKFSQKNFSALTGLAGHLKRDGMDQWTTPYMYCIRGNTTVQQGSVSKNPLWLPKAPFQLMTASSSANSRPFTLVLI